MQEHKVQIRQEKESSVDEMLTEVKQWRIFFEKKQRINEIPELYEHPNTPVINRFNEYAEHDPMVEFITHVLKQNAGITVRAQEAIQNLEDKGRHRPSQAPTAVNTDSHANGTAQNIRRASQWTVKWIGGTFSNFAGSSDPITKDKRATIMDPQVFQRDVPHQLARQISGSNPASITPDEPNHTQDLSSKLQVPGAIGRVRSSEQNSTQAVKSDLGFPAAESALRSSASAERLLRIGQLFDGFSAPPTPNIQRSGSEASAQKQKPKMREGHLPHFK